MTGNLDIQGTLTSDGLTVGSSTLTESASDLIIDAADDLFLRANGQDAIRIFQDASSLQNIGFRNTAQDGSTFLVNGNGDISFYDTSGNAKFFWDASDEAVRIGPSEWPTTYVGKSANRHSIVADGSPLMLLWDASTGAQGNSAQLWVGGKPTNSATSFSGGMIEGGVENSTNDDGYMSLQTSSNGSGLVERVRIDSDGVVSITDSSGNEPTLQFKTATAANYFYIARDSANGHTNFVSEETGSAIRFHTDPDGTGAKLRTEVTRWGDVKFYDDDGATPSFTFDASDANITLTRNGTFAGTDNTQLNFFHYNDTGNPTGQILVGGTTNYTGDMVFKVRGGGTSGGGGAAIYEYMRIRGNEREVVFNQDGYDHDFRIEANYNSNLFVCEGGGTGLVHIGKATGGFANSGCSFYPQGEINLTTNDNRVPLYLNRQHSDGSIIAFYRTSTTFVGSVAVTSSGTTYNTTSDRRLKDNIEPIADATDKLMAMKPVTHTWKADPEADAVHGFIAQEMQEIVPEAVSGDPDGEEMMSMDYGRITPVLVAALQEATNEIKALKERVAELEAK
jgi:hypothetical protein